MSEFPSPVARGKVRMGALENGNCQSPKAEKQSDRCRACSMASSPPPSICWI